MKINNTEILLDGTMDMNEIQAYIERATDIYGREPIRMSVRVEGEEVALGYTFEKVPFERIRRITGYLSKVENFNNGKLSELADRTTHGGTK